MADVRWEAMGGGALYAEHLKLGATFGDGRVPVRYAADPGNTVLADVSDVRALLLAGDPAPSFAHAAFAGAALAVGACAFEAVLTGDGALASVPLLLRTGTSEFLALDASPRAEVLDGWLSFLAGVSQDGVEPFAGLEAEDATGSHTVLLLWGPDAPGILGDYLGAQRAPASGRVASLMLDRIPCIVACVPGLRQPCYLLFVPPVHAVALWRSLLSFVEVSPMGREGLVARLAGELPWANLLGEADVLRPSGEELAGWGLMRGQGDFVGHRGLGGRA